MRKKNRKSTWWTFVSVWYLGLKSNTYIVIPHITRVTLHPSNKARFGLVVWWNGCVTDAADVIDSLRWRRCRRSRLTGNDATSKSSDRVVICITRWFHVNVINARLLASRRFIRTFSLTFTQLSQTQVLLGFNFDSVSYSHLRCANVVTFRLRGTWAGCCWVKSDKTGFSCSQYRKHS